MLQTLKALWPYCSKVMEDMEGAVGQKQGRPAELPLRFPLPRTLRAHQASHLQRCRCCALSIRVRHYPDLDCPAALEAAKVMKRYTPLDLTRVDVDPLTSTLPHLSQKYDDT